MASCVAILKTGPRKGQQCGCKAKNGNTEGNPLCGRHAPKIIAPPPRHAPVETLRLVEVTPLVEHQSPVVVSRPQRVVELIGYGSAKSRKQLRKERQRAIREHVREIEQVSTKKIKDFTDIIRERKANTKKAKKEQRLAAKAEARAVVNPDFFMVNNVPNGRIREVNRLVSVPLRQPRANRKKALTQKYHTRVMSIDDIKNELLAIHQQKRNVYKVSLHFSLILQTENGDLKLFDVHDNANNLRFNEPVLIRNARDLTNFLKTITIEKLLEHLTLQDTKTKFIGIKSMVVETTSTELVLGKYEGVPEYMEKSRCLNVLKDSPGELCLFSCIALKKGAPRNGYKAKAKELFKEYYGKDADVKRYGGYDLNDLQTVATFFKLTMNVWKWGRENDEDVFTSVMKTIDRADNETLDMVVHKRHLMYVTKPTSLMKNFVCEGCKSLFSTRGHLYQHQKHSCGKDKVKVPDESYIVEPTVNKIRELNQKYLKDYKGELPYHHPYEIVYDYEAMLLKKSEASGDTTVYTQEHVPVSCSVNSNVPGYGIKFFCAKDGNIRAMNKAIVDYCLEASDASYALLWKSFTPLIKAICSRCYDDDEVDEILCGNLQAFDEEKSERRNYRFAKMDWKVLKAFMKRTPLIGFNSQKYDINMAKEHGLISYLYNDNIDSVIKTGSAYMALNTERLSVMDISKYLAPGTSYDKMLKTYCPGGLTKGFFPYEWLDSLDKLDEPLPPRSAFHSSLRNTDITPADYEYVKKVWSENGMETMYDFLKWYNDLDVIPFVDAIEAIKKNYRDQYKLDLFKDALSVSGYGEKIMINMGYGDYLTKGFKYMPVKNLLGKSFTPMKDVIVGYTEQDEKAGRVCDLSDSDVQDIIDEYNGCCFWCRKQLNGYNFTLDRIDNNVGHTRDNCLLSCKECNVRRGDKLYNAFFNQCKLENYVRDHPQIVITNQQEIYDELRQSMVGGPSIVFHRYHEAGVTKIREAKYGSEAKTCQKVVGYDANALYLWCLGQEMPCGELEYIENPDLSIIDEVRSGEFFGFVSVDMHVPDNLKEYFSEMQPIFKNVEFEYTAETVGEYMNDIIQENEATSSGRKLLGSYFCQKQMFLSSLLKWYLEHGLVVTKVHSAVRGKGRKIFEPFMEYVAQERRNGDANSDLQVLAETAKILGNGAAGHTIINKTRQTKCTITKDVRKALKKINKPTFRALDEIDDWYEIDSCKDRIKLNNPLQVGVAVYNWAKLRMLSFYYDVLDKFYDRHDFQMIEMDTDSNYLGISAKSWDEMPMKPGMQTEFERIRLDWFMDTSTPERTAYTRRTPGLFKVEYEGDCMVALAPKVYRVDDKLSCKGTQKSRNQDRIVMDSYKNALCGNIIKVNNAGFRLKNGRMNTYNQTKNGLTPYYTKRRVRADGVTCDPILV